MKSVTTREYPQKRRSATPAVTPQGGTPTKDKYSDCHIVIPYTKGLGESIKKICNKYGILTHFKGNRTITEMLVKPKDKDPIDRKSGAIYWYQCGELTCDEGYIGETSRTIGEKYKEHLKEPSPIPAHSVQTWHSTTPENFNIIGRRTMA